MSAPLVVNTRDGMCWTRRTVTSSGIALYAPAGVCSCPEFVMATLSELAEHGIAGSADVLPMPVGPEPRSAETELEGARLALWEAEQRIVELEAERAKYVGKEPTIAEEMAYLSRCIDAVDALKLPEALKVDSIDPQYRNGYVHALADMRTALEAPERTSYPPALPWARLMDAEDLADFLDELAASAVTYDNGQALAEVEKTCGTWRAIAEAQHAHNTAPGPDAARQSFAERASRETDSGRRVAWRMLAQEMPDGEFHEALHHSYEVGHDLPETGGEHSC